MAPPFFHRDACLVAVDLLGCTIRHKVQGEWLCALIIETEAYYAQDRGSHASLGYTKSRRSLFAPPGTIYMYYARGGDSFNLSCGGPGDAVLIKSAVPWDNSPGALERMHALNPSASGKRRPDHALCSGQTLLCRALDLKVPALDGLTLGLPHFQIVQGNYSPSAIVQTTRLGIPGGRHEELWQRFVVKELAARATKNPLTMRGSAEGKTFMTLAPDGAPRWERTVHGL
ncbi:DNA-3-methyladenine glycosylase [Myxococcota bacterium]|nr:DNA-3-methyladenine glycosylase [Myxococcota bacterium]MBU1537184.1 DNA-3-methyladenine glycosylase [Myxococcota bacterium]